MKETNIKPLELIKSTSDYLNLHLTIKKMHCFWIQNYNVTWTKKTLQQNTTYL